MTSPANPTAKAHGFITPEVDVCGCDVVQALVLALVVVVVDEGFNLSFEIAWQKAVFQQDEVLQGLMPSFLYPAVDCTAINESGLLFLF